MTAKAAGIPVDDNKTLSSVDSDLLSDSDKVVQKQATDQDTTTIVDATKTNTEGIAGPERAETPRELKE